jgi:hypothetical protein
VDANESSEIQDVETTDDATDEWPTWTANQSRTRI